MNRQLSDCCSANVRFADGLCWCTSCGGVCGPVTVNDRRVVKSPPRDVSRDEQCAVKFPARRHAEPSFKAFMCAVTVWIATSTNLFAQAQLTPQLKALLDFYFRGPGSSNSVSSFQIQDGAITLPKLDADDVASLFALKTWVQDQLDALDFVAPGELSGLETDPVWLDDKPDYATISFVNSQGFSTSNPYTNSYWVAVDPNTFYTGVVTNHGIGVTNRMTFEDGFLLLNEVNP